MLHGGRTGRNLVGIFAIAKKKIVSARKRFGLNSEGNLSSGDRLVLSS